MRSRIELRPFAADDPALGLGIGCAMLVAVGALSVGVTALSSVVTPLALVPVIILGSLSIMLLAVGGLRRWERTRPIAYVLELAPEGSPHGVSLRSPEGTLLGETRDGSLVVRDARYLRSARGGARWRAAVVLEVRGTPVGALACLGPADVRADATAIDTPRLGDLYPRELEYLRARGAGSA